MIRNSVQNTLRISMKFYSTVNAKNTIENKINNEIVIEKTFLTINHNKI